MSERVRIGIRVATLLDAVGQNQAWLAAKAGVERSTVARVLTGDRNPTTETLELLAPVLGVTLEELVAGTDAADRISHSRGLISREHYVGAVKQLVEFEAKATDLTRRVADLESRNAELAARIERERQDAAYQCRLLEEQVAEVRRERDRHDHDSQRYRRGLERAVADVAGLQTQLRAVAAGVKTGRVAAVVAASAAGLAMVVTVAHYLRDSPRDPRGGGTGPSTSEPAEPASDQDK